MTGTAVRVGVAINPHDPDNRYEIAIIRDIGDEMGCLACEPDSDAILVRVSGQTPADAIGRLRDTLQEKSLSLQEVPTPEWWANLEQKFSMVC